MGTEIRADLAANVWKIIVSEGQNVDEDETLMVLESMKMEIPVTASEAGVVTALAVHEGDMVEEDQLLVELN